MTITSPWMSTAEAAVYLHFIDPVTKVPQLSDTRKFIAKYPEVWSKPRGRARMYWRAHVVNLLPPPPNSREASL